MNQLALDENTKVYLMKHHPDLYRIVLAVESLLELSGSGSVEVHYVKKRIRENNGIYIKPGIDFTGVEKNPSM